MRSISYMFHNIKKRFKEKKKSSIKKIREKKSEKFLKRKHIVRDYLWKAGVRVSEQTISKAVFIFVIIVNIIISSYLVINSSVNYGFSLTYTLIALFFVWVLLSSAILSLVWLIFYFGIDILIYRRKVEIEEVLPDFLQLTSANIRAGMPIDRSLWFAVRPRFGVLAKEIEEVAKRTFAGEELEVALREFSAKYDSLILRRSMYLLIEGLKAGGEVGGLLDRIATNIQQTHSMKKELAANVMTYVIFISVAVIFGAPFLFALSNNLIMIIQQIGGQISTSAAGSAGMGFSFSPDVIDLKDFKIFAYISLAITSFAASAIISTIQKGTIKAGIKYIPAFMFATITLFFIFSSIFESLFSGFFI